MHYYKFKLITNVGEIISGMIKLPYIDILSAITHLEKGENTVIYVKKPGPVHLFFFKLLSIGSKKKLKRAAQAELLSNISLMIKSGVNLTNALEEASDGAEIPEIGDDIYEMISMIQSGAVFSEAATSFPHIFPSTIIHLIKIGEETGKLDKMLDNAANHLKNIEKIVSDTKQALMYPGFVFLAMTLLVFFWFYYVIPQILNLFKEMDVTLPAITLFLLNLSDFIRNNILVIIVLIVTIPIGFATARKHFKSFKTITDKWLIKVPVAGTIITASSLAYISEYLSLLLNSGIDILNSLTILHESVGNELYRNKILEIKEGILKGHGVTESFTETAIFPSFVTRMIGVGELSGTLTEQLDHIADEYRNRLSVLVSSIGKALEPIVLLVAGALFIVIIAGLLLPIYDLISKIS